MKYKVSIVEVFYLLVHHMTRWPVPLLIGQNTVAPDAEEICQRSPQDPARRVSSCDLLGRNQNLICIVTLMQSHWSFGLDP